MDVVEEVLRPEDAEAPNASLLESRSPGPDGGTGIRLSTASALRELAENVRAGRDEMST